MHLGLVTLVSGIVLSNACLAERHLLSGAEGASGGNLGKRPIEVAATTLVQNAEPDKPKRLVIVAVATPAYVYGAENDNLSLRLMVKYLNETLEENSCPELKDFKVELNTIKEPNSAELKSALDSEKIDDSSAVMVLMRLPGVVQDGQHRLEFVNSKMKRYADEEKKEKESFDAFAKTYDARKDPEVWVPREDILKWMRARNPRLAVLLTDSSADPERARKSPQLMGGPVRGVLGHHGAPCPFFRDLFLSAKGVVDITAAWPRKEDSKAEAKAWGDSTDGGYFLSSVVAPLSGNLPSEYTRLPQPRPTLEDFYRQQIESDGRPGITWGEYFNYVQKTTNEKFLRARRGMEGKDESYGNVEILAQDRQLPYAFEPLPK